ncbi:Hydrogenase expression/formation protein HypE [bacterium HR10]|nr:Hydrogenase expression/formation protein HypE [bacterium HR10]
MRRDGPRAFAVGKLPPDVLQRALAAIPVEDERVKIGPRLGEDAAAIAFGDVYLVAKTDPITFAAERIGWYAVHINANDVAVMGARPRWFLAALLLPEGKTDAALVDHTFRDILSACRELGITLCGGHTEVTYGLDRPVVVGHMLGEVPREKLVEKRMEPGDRVLLTKGIAIEGTAILAREKAAELASVCEAGLLERARRLLFDPGISVVREALRAVEVAHVHAMHDPTEGGLVGGLCELAAAGGVGLHIWRDRIPLRPETDVICRHLGLDPLRLIASGALLIVAPPDQCSRIGDALRSEGIEVAEIGEVRERAYGLKLEVDGEPIELTFPERDEIARVFETIPSEPGGEEGRFSANDP